MTVISLLSPSPHPRADSVTQATQLCSVPKLNIRKLQMTKHSCMFTIDKHMNLQSTRHFFISSLVSSKPQLPISYTKITFNFFKQWIANHIQGCFKGEYHGWFMKNTRSFTLYSNNKEQNDLITQRHKYQSIMNFLAPCRGLFPSILGLC